MFILFSLSHSLSLFPLCFFLSGTLWDKFINDNETKNEWMKKSFLTFKLDENEKYIKKLENCFKNKAKQRGGKKILAFEEWHELCVCERAKDDSDLWMMAMMMFTIHFMFKKDIISVFLVLYLFG